MRTVTIGETTLTIDRDLVRTDTEHGVEYRINAHEVLTCEKLVCYPGEVPIERPEWTIVHEGGGDFWVLFLDTDANVDLFIDAGERKAATAHVRRTKPNPED